MTTKACIHYGNVFTPRPQIPTQVYCSRPECQRARKRQWQQEKLRSDPAYQDNQRDAQRNWRTQHTDYWRDYRAAHPEYVEKNCARRRKPSFESPERVVANMDVSMPPPGPYWIHVLTDFPRTKPGIWLVELQAVCAACGCKKDACKERT